MFEIRELGFDVDYQYAWNLQKEIHADVVSGSIPDTVLLLQHSPTFTAGKRTEPGERPFDGTPVIDVDRGGKITWHGPGQLVGYPILRLPEPLDVVEHVRRIEGMLIHVCAEFGVRTKRVAGRSGVWVSDSSGDRKIAAIGIRVSHGVTLHGFALNCDNSLDAFSSIIPCGITDASVTTLSRETGRSIGVDDVIPTVRTHLAEIFDSSQSTPIGGRTS